MTISVDKTTDKSLAKVKKNKVDKVPQVKFLILNKSILINKIKKWTTASEVKRLDSKNWKYVYDKYKFNREIKNIYVYQLSNDAKSILLDISMKDLIIEKFYSNFNFNNNISDMCELLKVFEGLRSNFDELEDLSLLYDKKSNQKAYDMIEKLLIDHSKLDASYFAQADRRCETKFLKALKNKW